MYYSDKLEELKKIFLDDSLSITNNVLLLQGQNYPIIDDVIVLLTPEEYTPYVRERLCAHTINQVDAKKNEIQFTFGKEWECYNSILPEHKKEFEAYFDLVDLNALKDKVVCDLGCGNGRWSHFLYQHVKTLILIDFSDAIFVACANLSTAPNTIFIMADLRHLPLRMPFADFTFCIGVLHHLPSPCLDVIRNIKEYSNSFLIYLYYSLDNRSAYFQYILKIISVMRVQLAKIHSKTIRNIIAKTLTITLYYPCIYVGIFLKPLKLSRYIPIYDGYHGKSFARIEQDVYDRFFTSIEQRVSKKEIESLSDTFSDVIISDSKPYWHFYLKR